MKMSNAPATLPAQADGFHEGATVRFPRLREVATDALRYWEPRRALYCIILAAVVINYYFAGLPGSAAKINIDSLLVIFALAVVANVCYCAAYIVDAFIQLSGFRSLWRQWRWLLLFVGISFAATITRFIAMGYFLEKM